MQTFLPYSDINQSVKCLDWRRLCKQRIEALQILNCLRDTNPNRGWKSHPAVLMWRGYEDCLLLYMNECIKEWTRRGYRNTMLIHPVSTEVVFPIWWGGKIHASHRAALLFKDYNWYLQFGWIEKPEIRYHWPI